MRKRKTVLGLKLPLNSNIYKPGSQRLEKVRGTQACKRPESPIHCLTPPAGTRSLSVALRSADHVPLRTQPHRVVHQCHVLCAGRSLSVRSCPIPGCTGPWHTLWRWASWWLSLAHRASEAKPEALWLRLPLPGRSAGGAQQRAFPSGTAWAAARQ